MKQQPIQLVVPDWDDQAVVDEAVQVITMLEDYGYPVGFLYVASRPEGPPASG